MREAFVIAKREFVERVRTKWFVAMTILGPVLMIALIVIPVLLAGKGTHGAKIEIVDETGVLGDALVKGFAADSQQWQATLVAPTTSDKELLDHIKHKQIAGFLRVPKDALEHGKFVYRGDNATNQMVLGTLYKTITPIVQMQRAAPLHLPPERVLDLLSPPNIADPIHTNGESEGESGEATFFLGYIIALILYMTITLYGVNVMTSVVTEKTSRVVELMCAATTPRAMMSGKIAGVGGAALAQISIWLAVGGIGLANRDALLGAFGVTGGAGVLPSLSGFAVLVVGVFFALGFLFYSTMYAAVGAMVATEQDARQAQLPVTMFLIVGMVSMTAITGDPRGSTSAILTLVPFWSPMLMPLRYLLGGATATDVAISLAILAVSIALVSRAAAKIYRVGILMYGKRPGLAELVRWLRY
jgi:ABC-2 type transport system permease protein